MHNHGPHVCEVQRDAVRWSRRRLVTYSLVGNEARRGEHAYQLELSLSSLRASNPRIGVVLFAHDGLAPEIAELCRRFGVTVIDQGSYFARIAARAPHSAAALARFPLVHKCLNFAELAAFQVDQVLCCDLDTVFLQDVERLFDRYAGPDVVAREEVGSARSIHGADPNFIDERLLGDIVRHLSRSPVAPINTGVVLYNNRVVDRLVTAMAAFVDDVWRLLCGLITTGLSRPGIAADPAFEWMSGVRATARAADIERALPFPSDNAWIAEEIAWWLALGSVRGLTFADFSAADVAQTNEFTHQPIDRSRWVVCHYFSRNTHLLADWLRQPAVVN